MSAWNVNENDCSEEISLELHEPRAPGGYPSTAWHPKRHRTCCGWLLSVSATMLQETEAPQDSTPHGDPSLLIVGGGGRGLLEPPPSHCAPFSHRTLSDTPGRLGSFPRKFERIS